MSDAKSKIFIAALVAVGSAVSSAATMAFTSMRFKKQIKAINEENEDLRKSIRALLETWKIEAGKAERIIADLGNESALSQDEIVEKLKSHGLNKRQIEAILKWQRAQAQSGRSTSSSGGTA